MWQLGSVFDAFATPAVNPSPHALPVRVPIVDDPTLELSRATRALAGAEDLVSLDTMGEWSQSLDADDLHAVVDDMRAMRNRHIREIERADEDMRVDAAVVLKTMSELGSEPARPPPALERPHTAKRRRVDPASQPTVSATGNRTFAASANIDSARVVSATRARRRQLSPGQKRANHIVSEQRRRARIRAGCEALCDVVPALKTLEHHSFSKPEEFVIAETVAHIKRMQLNRAALLQRLGEARLASPDVPPSGLPETALWERT